MTAAAVLIKIMPVEGRVNILAGYCEASCTPAKSRQGKERVRKIVPSKESKKSKSTKKKKQREDRGRDFLPLKCFTSYLFSAQTLLRSVESRARRVIFPNA